MHSTTVWMAMPPRMLPTATSVCPATDALTTIAISGRLVATARKTSTSTATGRLDTCSPRADRDLHAVPGRSVPETRAGWSASAQGRRRPLRVAADEPEQPCLRVGVLRHGDGRAVL